MINQQKYSPSYIILGIDITNKCQMKYDYWTDKKEWYLQILSLKISIASINLLRLYYGLVSYKKIQYRMIAIQKSRYWY